MKKTFIAGPCVIESAELLDTVAAKLVEINKKLGTDIIFKASFDKANRTSIRSFRGPGIDRGLQGKACWRGGGCVADSCLSMPTDRPAHCSSSHWEDR